MLRPQTNQKRISLHADQLGASFFTSAAVCAVKRAASFVTVLPRSPVRTPGKKVSSILYRSSSLSLYFLSKMRAITKILTVYLLPARPTEKIAFAAIVSFFIEHVQISCERSCHSQTGFKPVSQKSGIVMN